MTNRRSWQRLLFLCVGGFLTVAGMAINTQATSVLGSPPTSTAAGETGFQIASKAKQALLVIFDRFGETAYSETRSILENKGVKVLVASSNAEPLTGHDAKMTVKPDMLLSQVRTAEYDAIVFIGGARYPGDNADAIRIAKEGAADRKVLGAISWGIFTLMKADLLKGKKIATFMDDFWVQKAEATVSGASVERDGIIITGAGQNASQPFAEAIAVALTAGAN